MVEMRNGKKVLITPVSAEDLKDIKVGECRHESDLSGRV